MNDLRVPTGLFFVLIGLILTAVGVLAPHYRPRLIDFNVNLACGLLLFFFGGILLWLARRRAS